MKKTTLVLSIIFASINFIYSQVNLTVIAPPPSNAVSSFNTPNGTSLFTTCRGAYIITQSELNALTAGTLISSIGFSLDSGTPSVPVSGNFTMYVQNTSNTTYAKGFNWPAILSGMTNVYSSVMTIPATANNAIISFSLPTAFTYTGGGLYVAFDWESTGPFDANPATFIANNVITLGGAIGQSSTSVAPTALFTGNFRPVFVIDAVNSATNEVSVTSLVAPGKVAKLFNGSQSVVADVFNGSIITKNNIVVTLTVSGANPFVDTQTITSIPAGSAASVTFAPYSPTVTGSNSMSVSIPADDNPNNNLARWTQSVTCNQAALNPPLTAINFSAQGVGFGASPTGGIYCFRYIPASSGSLTGVRVAVPSFTQNIGKICYAALLDAAGSIIATGNTVALTSSGFNTFVNFNFATPQDLTPSVEYFIGLGITAGNTFPIGTYTSSYLVTDFFSAPDGGGLLTQVDFDFLAIEASFAFPNTSLFVSATKSSICSGESVLLTTSGGATTYTWNISGVNTPTALVTPTLSGNAVYVVNGTNGPTACRTNSATVTVTVNACVGLSENAASFSSVKVYPNPAVNGQTKITGLSGTNTIFIYNILGQLVYTEQVTDESVTINLSNQPNGSYMVKIIDSANASKALKIVNQN
jgi:hypothetical protein